MDTPEIVTPTQIADLVINYRRSVTSQDLDHYLEIQLRGKRIVTGNDDETITVTGVINAGFNGQAIHGTTDDGTRRVHHIR